MNEIFESIFTVQENDFNELIFEQNSNSIGSLTLSFFIDVECAWHISNDRNSSIERWLFDLSFVPRTSECCFVIQVFVKIIEKAEYDVAYNCLLSLPLFYRQPLRWYGVEVIDIIEEYSAERRLLLTRSIHTPSTIIICCQYTK